MSVSEPSDRPDATGAGDTFLASPVLGIGLAVNLIDRLFLGSAHDEAAAIARVHAAIATGGLKVGTGERALESADEIEAHVRERAAFFFRDYLPFLRLAGVA